MLLCHVLQLCFHTGKTNKQTIVHAFIFQFLQRLNMYLICKFIFMCYKYIYIKYIFILYIFRCWKSHQLPKKPFLMLLLGNTVLRSLSLIVQIYLSNTDLPNSVIYILKISSFFYNININYKPRLILLSKQSILKNIKLITKCRKSMNWVYQYRFY